MEVIIGRLILLLVYYFDYSVSVDDFVDFVNYFLFFFNVIVIEENILLIYKYVERVK